MRFQFLFLNSYNIILVFEINVFFQNTRVCVVIAENYSLIGTDNEDVDGIEQTVYACSGSPLILRCGENETYHQDQVNLFVLLLTGTRLEDYILFQKSKGFI